MGRSPGVGGDSNNCDANLDVDYGGTDKGRKDLRAFVCADRAGSTCLEQ